MGLNSPSLILESSRFMLAAWICTSTSVSRTSGCAISPSRRVAFFAYRSTMKAFICSLPKLEETGPSGLGGRSDRQPELFAQALVEHPCGGKAAQHADLPRCLAGGVAPSRT